jgi:hypothetical protein
VIGLDVTGQPIWQTKFRRDRLLHYFANASPATIGMESCPGSQWLARKLQTMGHTVKIIPAQFVKPYVKSNKNDIFAAPLRIPIHLNKGKKMELPQPILVTIYLHDINSTKPLSQALNDAFATLDGELYLSVPLSTMRRSCSGACRPSCR